MTTLNKAMTETLNQMLGYDEPDRIFISGPMTGYENFNHEAFNRAEDYLRDIGYQRIFNPACIDANHSYRELLNICLNQLGTCDTIYMLKGWQKSHGAKVEHAYAIATGMTILYEGEKS